MTAPSPSPIDPGPIDPIDPGTDPLGEPVLIAHAVTAILAALVGTGWLTIDSAGINALGTAVAVIVATVAAFVARGKVTPTSTLAARAARLAVQNGPPAAAAPSAVAVAPATLPWDQWERLVSDVAADVAQHTVDTYVSGGNGR